MKAVSLFSGIDGFAIAAESVGWDVVAHCEIDPFCRMILETLYPNSTLHGSITTTDFTIYRGRVNIVFGGFPCQPVSIAGKQKGTDDERFLWAEMFRAVREISPRWVVAENVRGLLSQSGGLVFEQVCADLETAGYEVQTFLLPAAGVGAPHERYRIVIVGYAEHNGFPATEERGNDHQPPQQAGQDTQRQPEGADSLQSGTGIIANPDHEGAGSGYRSVSEKNGKVSEWNENTESCDSSSGIITDTKSIGNRGWCNGSCGKCYSSEIRQDFQCQTEGFGSKQPSTYTPAIRAQRVRSGGEQKPNAPRGKGLPVSNDTGGMWQDFPTQSPVCNGNDGFPTESLRQRIRTDSMGYLSEEEIDKIISKARTEWTKGTIKAGGNAVVPQLFMQVFKAIQQYENLYHS